MNVNKAHQLVLGISPRRKSCVLVLVEKQVLSVTCISKDENKITVSGFRQVQISHRLLQGRSFGRETGLRRLQHRRGLQVLVEAAR